MRTGILFDDLVMNPSLRKFFFRAQANETFEEVVKATVDSPERMEEITHLIEDWFTDLANLEDWFYEESADQIIEQLTEV